MEAHALVRSNAPVLKDGPEAAVKQVLACIANKAETEFSGCW